MTTLSMPGKINISQRLNIISTEMKLQFLTRQFFQIEMRNHLALLIVGALVALCQSKPR